MSTQNHASRTKMAEFRSDLWQVECPLTSINPRVLSTRLMYPLRDLRLAPGAGGRRAPAKAAARPGGSRAPQRLKSERVPQNEVPGDPKNGWFLVGSLQTQPKGVPPPATKKNVPCVSGSSGYGPLVSFWQTHRYRLRARLKPAPSIFKQTNPRARTPMPLLSKPDPKMALLAAVKSSDLLDAGSSTCWRVGSDHGKRYGRWTKLFHRLIIVDY